MPQYNVDIFDRSMVFVANDIIEDIKIDDDYISAKANTIEITPADGVSSGQFIRLENDSFTFFGVITDVSPSKTLTTITFKPFISVFDELFVFDTTMQSTSDSVDHPTLEATIYYYMSELYVTNEDTLQRIPLTITIDPSITQTSKWSLNITPDIEGGHHSIIHLYSVLIVNALKKYGVAVQVTPNFSQKTVELFITKVSTSMNIDGDLDNVNVKTLKYTDRPTGTNKLEVYDATDFGQQLIFYVYPDKTWGIEDTNRITPVVREVQSVAPDSNYENPTEGFAAAALDVAYSVLSGLQWDNLIELEVYPDDENVSPADLVIGQTISLWYKGGKYTSMLTGKILSAEVITLLFGSERIEYSKRSKW